MPDRPPRAGAVRPTRSPLRDALAGELGLRSAIAHGARPARATTTPTRRARFLAADERARPVGASAASTTACDADPRHVARGSRIVVHGDYDVDGVCSTAMLVRALRALGRRRRAGTCPAASTTATACRGHGRAARRRRAPGCWSRWTAAITAVEEVARARALGIDVVVTDHHRPGRARCPTARSSIPALGGYPFPELCAAGVAYKLAEALLRGGGRATRRRGGRTSTWSRWPRSPTCVPLRGENRRLVREGLRGARAHAQARAARADAGRRAATRARSTRSALGFRLGAAHQRRRAAAAAPTRRSSCC